MAGRTTCAGERTRHRHVDRGVHMKRLLFFTGAAMLAAVPAAVGLAGNPSLSPSVPVDPPSQAVVLDDHGGATDRDLRTEPGDDRAAQADATTSPSPVAAMPSPAPTV